MERVTTKVTAGIVRVGQSALPSGVVELPDESQDGLATRPDGGGVWSLWVPHGQGAEGTGQHTSL